MKFKKNKGINYVPKYDLFSKSVVIGFISFLAFGFLLVSSIVKLPYVSTIHAYSFGFLFGYYSYAIYGLFLIASFMRVFNLNMSFQKLVYKKIKIKNIRIALVFLFIGCFFVIENVQNWNLLGKQFGGAELWDTNFNDWWKNYSGVINPWLPNFDICGVIILFLVTLLNFWTGFLLNILIGLFLIFLCFWYLLQGSPIKFIQQKQVAKKNEIKNFQDHLTKIVNAEFEDKNPLINEKEMLTKETKIEPTKVKKTETEIFVFDDEFASKTHKTTIDKTILTEVAKEQTEDVFETTFLFSNTDSLTNSFDSDDSKNNVKYKKENDSTFVFNTNEDDDINK